MLKFVLYPQKIPSPLFAAYSRVPNENPLPQGVFTPQGKSIINYFKDRKKNIIN